MMEEQERATNPSDVGSDMASAEAMVRAALAAHPWPQFGEGLHGRLRAIAASEPDALADGSRDARRPRAGEAATPTTPRDVRSWRREAWAMAVVFAGVVGLAIALAGTARLRQARPVEGPHASTPTPASVATDAAIAPIDGITNTSGLSGRLIYFVPGEGEGNASVFALDMRTGRSERLWEVPGSADGAKWAISPDGTRLAYAKGTPGDAEVSLYVRHLDAAAPEPLALASLGAPERADAAAAYVQVDRLVWSSDNASLYFGVLFTAEAFEGAMPHLEGWELHRLTLDDSRRAAGTPPAGSLAVGIDAGEDRVLAHIEPDDLPPGSVADLLAVDAANHRAAVAIGPGENGQVDAIGLVDTESGLEVQRLATGSVEGFKAAVTADGARLAYADGGRATEDGTTYWIHEVTIASAVSTTTEVSGLPARSPVSVRIAAWSGDARWLAWETAGENGDQQGHIALMEAMGAGRSEAVNVDPFDGAVVAFSPDGEHLLTATGAVLDLTAGSLGPPRATLLPWPAPSGMAWAEAPRRVLGWIADGDRTAVATPGQSTPTMVPDDASIVLPPVATVAAPKGTNVGVTTLEPWSPDGRWLPFWMSSQHADLPAVEPAQLWFLDARTDTACVQAGLQRRSHSDRIFWQPDGRVVVRVDGVPSIAQPCGVLSPLPSSTVALPTARPAETPLWAEPLERGQQVLANESRVAEGNPAEDRSTDGRWLATTAPIDGPLGYVTTITSIADGRRIADRTWQRADTWDDWDPAMAGTWLPSGAYLIFRTADHGPLLFTTDGAIRPAGDALFGVPSASEEPASSRVRVLWNADGDDWHAVLEGHGHLHLYHPEIPQVEQLPHAIFVGADDGPLLTIGDDPAPVRQDPAGRWYVRPIDALEAPFTAIDAERAILTTGVRSAAIAPDGQVVALHDMVPNIVSLYRIDDLGREIGRWRLDGYVISTLRWSPDGRTLAVEGHVADTPDAQESRALFLLHPPSEP